MASTEASRNLRDLLTLFTFAKKRELEVFARTLVVREGAFVDLILACDQGLLPFKRGAHYKHSAPKDLPPTFKATGPSRPGAAPELDLKKVRVVLNRLHHETSWAAGHLFYTPGFYEWHFFVFDNHDQKRGARNHWQAGVHMHFVNWLWPRLDAERVWTDFVRDGKKPGSSLHIRDESEAA